MIKCENACPRGKFDGCCHKCPDFHTCPDSCQESPNACGSATFDEETALQEFKNTQLANKIIYFSLPQGSELWEQSQKRIHRLGQERPCFYYLMICPGTVEEDILSTLEMRKDYTDELFRKYEQAATAPQSP